MATNKIPFSDALCLMSMKQMLMYSKKEINFLYHFMKDIEFNTYHVHFPADKRVELMVLCHTRNESYLYRLLGKFIRNGHIHKRRKGFYIIDPKLIFFGDLQTWLESHKKFNSIVYTDTEAI